MAAANSLTMRWGPGGGAATSFAESMGVPPTGGGVVGRDMLAAMQYQAELAKYYSAAAQGFHGATQWVGVPAVKRQRKRRDGPKIVSEVCANCRRSKVKCNDEKPCNFCIQHEIQDSCLPWRMDGQPNQNPEPEEASSFSSSSSSPTPSTVTLAERTQRKDAPLHLISTKVSVTHQDLGLSSSDKTTDNSSSSVPSAETQTPSLTQGNVAPKPLQVQHILGQAQQQVLQQEWQQPQQAQHLVIQQQHVQRILEQAQQLHRQRQLLQHLQLQQQQQVQHILQQAQQWQLAEAHISAPTSVGAGGGGGCPPLVAISGKRKSPEMRMSADGSGGGGGGGGICQDDREAASVLLLLASCVPKTSKIV